MRDVAATHTAKPKTRTRRSQIPTAEHDLADAVASLVTHDDDHVAVAVDDLTTRQTASYNGTNTEFITASIVKADIMVTLEHQTGGDLSSYEQELATSMIENSDNDATTALFQEIGGASALATADELYGMTETTPNVAWGLTTTTADDQLTAIEVMIAGPSACGKSRTRLLLALAMPASDGGTELTAAAVNEDTMRMNPIPISTAGPLTVSSDVSLSGIAASHSCPAPSGIRPPASSQRGSTRHSRRDSTGANSSGTSRSRMLG